MKKIGSILLLAILLIVPGNIYASSVKTYEVPVHVMHHSRQEGKKSMSDKAVDRMALVKEEGGKLSYSIVFKPMEFMNTKGNITNLFILNGDSKSEAKKTMIGEKGKFQFQKGIEKEKDIEVAFWVDVMDEMSGGKPGSGEQKAFLHFDWENAKVKEEQKAPVKPTKKEISILVNKKNIEMDVKPFIENNRTMVPVRFISEALGLKVDWDNETRTVLVGEKASSIQLQIGKDQIKKADGSLVKIDSPAVIRENRTFVPLRAIAEISGAKVDWEGNTRTVVIEK